MIHTQCKTCDGGVMDVRKEFRLGAVGVVFGILIGLASALGLLGGVVGFVTFDDHSEEILAEIDELVRPGLEEAGIPESMIQAIKDSDVLPDVETRQLTTDQRTAITSARLGLCSYQLRIGAEGVFALGMCTVLLLVSPVGVLVTFLLTLRKKVLQCRNCDTVVPAS